MNILNRKNLFSGHSAMLLIVIIAILAVVNLISANHFGRIDLTADKQYSLSDATKNSVAKLQDPLFIKVYFSSKLPPDLAQTSQYVKDILSEYRAYSSNIKIEFIDPAKDEQLKKEIQSLGIPEVEMQVLEKDEFKVQKGYLGLAMFYLDKKEIMPIIQDTRNLEYELTSAIKRMTAFEQKTIGFLSGHGEHGIYQTNAQSASQVSNYTSVQKALAKNYLVKTVDVSTGQPIKDINTLIIAGPKSKLSERELYEIDQFIMRGGKAIFLVDEVNLGQGLQATVNPTDIEKLLANYGIQVNADLVADASNETVGFSSGNMQFLLPYPFWPKLTQDNFLKDNPIVSRLQSISLPWVSSLSQSAQEGIDLKTLATTSKKGLAMTEPFNLDPQQQLNFTAGSKLPIVMEAGSKFKSLYAGQEAPKLEESKDTATKPVTAPEAKTIDQAQSDSQIIAVADSDLIADEYLQRFPDNLTFFLNAVDYLTLDSDLISIRAKTISEHPLKKTDESAKTIIKVINIGLIPLIIIIIGVVRFFQRKKSSN